MKLDTHQIYMEIARRKWSVQDLCNRIEWNTARFNQMMNRGSAPLKSIGVLAEALDVPPEQITKKTLPIRRVKNTGI